MGATSHRLGNLTALVDINALQADGPTAGVLSHRTDRRQSGRRFGWFVQRVDGNDVDALARALDDTSAPAVRNRHAGQSSVRHQDRARRAAVWRTGKAHFMRIDADEWQLCRDQLTAAPHQERRQTTIQPRHRCAPRR